MYYSCKKDLGWAASVTELVFSCLLVRMLLTLVLFARGLLSVLAHSVVVEHGQGTLLVPGDALDRSFGLARFAKTLSILETSCRSIVNDLHLSDPTDYVSSPVTLADVTALGPKSLYAVTAVPLGQAYAACAKTGGRLPRLFNDRMRVAFHNLLKATSHYDESKGIVLSSAPIQVTCMQVGDDAASTL